jgi:hypothetical protein
MGCVEIVAAAAAALLVLLCVAIKNDVNEGSTLFMTGISLSREDLFEGR